MEIKKDTFQVNVESVDAVGGAKPEPEERPVTRVLEVGNLTTHGSTPINPMKSAVTATRTVDEFARNATTCRDCVHFDNARWLKTLNKWKQSTDPFEQAELAMARGHLTTSNVMLESRGQKDHIDASLSVYGLCKAYTQYFKEELKFKDGYVTWVHPDAVCPGSTNRGVTLPKLFKAKKDTFWAKIRDNLLFTAQRKKGL